MRRRVTSYCEGRERREEILENNCQAVIREESSPVVPPSSGKTGMEIQRVNRLPGGTPDWNINKNNWKFEVAALSVWLVGRKGWKSFVPRILAYKYRNFPQLALPLQDTPRHLSEVPGPAVDWVALWGLQSLISVKVTALSTITVLCTQFSGTW